MPRSEGEGRHVFHLTIFIKVKQALGHSVNVSKLCLLPPTFIPQPPTYLIFPLVKLPDLQVITIKATTVLLSATALDIDAHLIDNGNEVCSTDYSLSTTSAGNWKFGCKAGFAFSVTKTGSVARYTNGVNTMS